MLVPVKPILSMVISAQHKLAKFPNVQFDPVLKYFSSHILKGSFTYAEQIKSNKSDNAFTAFFNVKRLFTNVPIDQGSAALCNSRASFPRKIAHGPRYLKKPLRAAFI